MSRYRSSMISGAVIVALLLGACSSGDDDSSEDTGGATESTAEASDTTAGASDSTEPADTTETTGAVETELPNPCDALTAEEFNVVTGLDATAEVDEFLTTMCNYLDANGIAYAMLTVGDGTTTQAVLDGFVDAPPPGATFTEVSGIGESAVVSEPPEGRALMVAGNVGYDLSKGLGSAALPADQLEELLRSIIAE